MEQNTYKKCIKTALTYLVLSGLCIAVTSIYTSFGHGIRSLYMDYAFLYPLVGGAAVFFASMLFFRLLPQKLRRISRSGYNLYNSGVACLCAASLLDGIMQIAGTDSGGILYVRVAGFVFIAFSLPCQIVEMCKK